jgi:phosphoadenosine phosphosulfate reductase
MTTSHDDLVDELRHVSQTFETASPGEILDWTFSRFGDDVAFACSFEDVALLHLIHERRPLTEVIFLDTGAHFPETYDFLRDMTAAWDLRVVVTQPGPEAEGTPCGAQNCCQVRKVAPLQRAVAGREAWITSVKRVDAPTRATMSIVDWDDKFGLVKVNPFATWSDDDVAYYLRSHDLPEHPLWAQGYTSIGCAPVTVKPLDPSDRRSGRWAGLDKEECGLHEA